MNLGRYRMRLLFTRELYYRFGLGAFTRAGFLGTQYGDERPDLFREIDLLLGGRVLRLRADWKGAAP